MNVNKFNGIMGTRGTRGCVVISIVYSGDINKVVVKKGCLFLITDGYVSTFRSTKGGIEIL